jgi:predicted nucleotidyltransferase
MGLKTDRLRLPIPTEGIPAFCRKWKVSRFELFGSVLRDDFRSESDVDVMVALDPSAKVMIWNWMDMQDELAAMFGRDVDLLARDMVEESTNRFRRDPILREATVIYEA